MRAASLIITLILLSTMIAGVSVRGDSGKIRVLSTLEIFSSIVERVGGEYVDSNYIVPSGSDIHDYSLTPEDVNKIRSAALIVLANSKFFSLESEILENVDGARILDFPDYNATVFPLGTMEHNYHGYWLYPENAEGIARAIYNALSSLDPEHGSYYRERYLVFLREVNDTVEKAHHLMELSGVEGSGVLLAVPGVFYAVKAFGFEVKGVIVEGPNQFISQQEIQKVKEMIRNGKIRMIVNARGMENSRAGSIAVELSRETGVKIAYVDVFSSDNYTDLLFRDASILSSVDSVSSYSGEECEYMPYIYSILILGVLFAFSTIMAYRYRRELLR